MDIKQFTEEFFTKNGVGEKEKVHILSTLVQRYETDLQKGKRTRQRVSTRKSVLK